MTRIKTSLAAAAALVLVFGTAGAALAQYPPTGAQCAQTFNADGKPKAVFSQGEEMGVAGEDGCFDAGSNVDVDLESAPIEFCDAVADAGGDFSCSDTIPSNMPVGEHDVVVNGIVDGEAVTYRNIITVSASGAHLPATGTDITLLAFWAIGLVVFGSLLVSATWRHFRGMRVEAVLARSAPGGVPAVDLPNDFAVKATTWVDDEAPAVVEPVAERVPTATEAIKPATERMDEVVSRLKEEIKGWDKR